MHKSSSQSNKEIIFNCFLYLIFFVALFVLIYETNQTYKETIVVDKRAQIYFLQLKTPVDDIYHQLLDLKDFRFLYNSQVCYKCKSDFLVVVVIHSALKNTLNRAAIRQTWGKQQECIKFVYLVGMTNDTKVTQMIVDENAEHNDIIQGNFLDTYRNLTYKHIMGLKWVAHNCPKAKYIVKTDDDLVVNTSRLYEVLKKDTWGETNFTACGIIWNAPVLRHDSKWAVTKEEYAEDHYPDYCNGPFIIYSADVVRRLLAVSRKVRFFWVDDVFVTGILAKMIGVRHIQLLYDDYYMGDAQKLLELGPKHVKPVIYGPLSLSPDDIRKIWNAMQTRNFE